MWPPLVPSCRVTAARSAFSQTHTRDPSHPAGPSLRLTPFLAYRALHHHNVLHLPYSPFYVKLSPVVKEIQHFIIHAIPTSSSSFIHDIFSVFVGRVTDLGCCTKWRHFGKPCFFFFFFWTDLDSTHVPQLSSCWLDLVVAKSHLHRMSRITFLFPWVPNPK